MIYLANDSIHYQTVFIPRQSYQSGTTRNPDYGSGLTSGDVINLITQSDAFERVVYDPTTKRIYFYNGEGTPATTSVDCTDFIKDGMVSEVKIENGYLIIVFNTDSGKENISIPLTDIFNPDNYYTKSETDTKLSEKQNNLVSGTNIKTINNQSILGPGNIEIKGTEYEAGENIDITNNTISVTGITVPTKTSELTNDSGFLTEHQSLSAYSTTEQMNSAISSATQDMATTGDLSTLKTEIESEIPDVSDFVTSGEVQTKIDNAIATETARTESTYLKEHQSLSAYSTTEQVQSMINSAKTEVEAEIPTKTSELTNDSGFLTEHQSLSAYSTTQEMNQAIDNAIAVETARTESTYLKEHQSLSAYSTTVEVEGMINTATQDMATTGDLNTLKTEIEAEIPDVSNFITSGQAQSQIDSAITTETARTENIYAKKTDIPVVPTSNTAFTNDAGYITEDALDGYATEEWVEGKGYLTEHQSLSAYSTTQEMNTAIDNATSGKQDTLIAGTNIDITNNTVSVTGITIPDVSQFITSGQAQSQIDSAITAETARTESTYLKEHQSLSAYSTTEQVQSMINSAKTEVEAEIPDVSNFVTSAQVETQITDKGYATTGQLNTVKSEIEAEIPDVSDFVTSGEVQTQINDSISGIPTQFKTINNESIIGSGNIEISAGTTYSAGTNIDITNNTISVTGITVPTKTSDLTNDSGFVTSGDVEERVEGFEETTSRALNHLNTRVNSKQDTLVSGTNIKTINNQSILGSGNINIQGGGGGGANIIELTQAEYNALTSYTEDALYVITDAETVDLNDYATSSDVQTLSGDVSNKVDKINTTASSDSYRTPRWNNQGQVTGYTQLYSSNLTINGNSNGTIKISNGRYPSIFAPTSAGSAGQPLLSNGSGAPVWGTYKFQFLSQSAYDALTTKDSTTIYFIIDEN